MATITIAVPLSPQIQTFTNPGGFYQGSRPFGELVFNDQGTAIAAKDAANTNVVTFNGQLPSGFVYRLVELRVMFNGVNEADFIELRPAMSLLFTENQVSLKETMLFNLGNPNAEFVLSAGATAIRNPAVTNDFSAIFLPLDGDRMYSDLIDAAQGVSIMQMISVNPSPSATAAMTVNTYARFLFYTIAQYRSGAIWDTSPIVT